MTLETAFTRYIGRCPGFFEARGYGDAERPIAAVAG